MSAQPIERVDIEVIEALDFHYTPPCEHSQHGSWPHGGSAFALIARTVHCASDVATEPIYICQPAWAHAGTVGLLCACGDVITRDVGWRLIAFVGGKS